MVSEAADAYGPDQLHFAERGLRRENIKVMCELVRHGQIGRYERVSANALRSTYIPTHMVSCPPIGELDNSLEEGVATGWHDTGADLRSYRRALAR